MAHAKDNAGFLRPRVEAAVELYRKNRGEFWQRGLFWTFWFHMAFFALGYGFREVMPLLSLVCLGFLYRYRWRESVLRRLPVLHLFACLWVMMVFGVVFSLRPFDSLLATLTTVNKGLVLPFVGMEAVRNLKDLKRLSVAFLVAFFWVGVDGIWQGLTGHDFVMGYPMRGGRLTAALGDYCVGNYMALALIPAMGVWYMLREKRSVLAALPLMVAALVPGVYTLIGAAARAGFVALVAVAAVWYMLSKRDRWLWHAPVVAGVVTLLLAFLQASDSNRMSLDGIAEDGRWNLWSMAVQVIAHWPMFGTGADMYNTAFRSLCLVPTRDLITIEHPHNLYLDILCSTGIVGALFGFTFLFGTLAWLARQILPRLRRASGQGNGATGAGADETDATEANSPLYWRLAGLFALAYFGWLVNGLTAHELYRTWWFAEAMSFLGIAMGAVIRGTSSFPTKTFPTTRASANPDAVPSAASGQSTPAEKKVGQAMDARPGRTDD